MISSLPQLNQMQYGGILKGKDITVGLRADYDKEYGKVCEALDGNIGGLNFKMSKLPNDLVCIQTKKENLYINPNGKLEGVVSLGDDREFVDRNFLDCNA